MSPSKLTVQGLVTNYVAAASAHARATASGDYATANKQHAIIAGVYRELRRRGPDSQRALLGLLTHPDHGVRGWAGAHALEFDPEAGEKALAGLITSGGIAGFDAKKTLEAWRRGQLTFP